MPVANPQEIVMTLNQIREIQSRALRIEHTNARGDVINLLRHEEPTMVTHTVTLTDTTNMPFPRVLGHFVDANAATEHLAKLRYEVVDMQHDVDHPGCFDIAANRGRQLFLFTIEPKKEA